MTAPSFDYDLAFSRNLGWVTPAEQQRLRSKCVAIAGLGGVGGSHLVTLARMGVARFHISDFDTFDLPNFNRQYGAFVHTVGRPKLEVMREIVLQINPEAQVLGFAQGVNASNLDAFLSGVDLYVDSLDVFVLDIRRQVFARCRERGVPAITAGPMGMGCAALAFTPQGMSFEDYFGLDGQTPHEQVLRFVAGLTPSMQQLASLVYPAGADLSRGRAPSMVAGIELCAGVAAAWALKILLGRGPVKAAPHGFHFDAYQNRLVKTWRPGGYRNPLQRAMLWLLRQRLRADPASS